MNLIDESQLLRNFEVIPNKKIGIFQGAGCSIQAGIPTAGSLIWEFKRKIYCANGRIREEKFKDLESERNKKEIQEYFDKQQEFPDAGSPNEYSFYFEQCYPEQLHRKLFIQKKIEKISPSLGHLCVGALIHAEKIDHVWTTNFDDLIEKGIHSCSTSSSFEVFSEDNKSFNSEHRSNYPKVLKLHGDYRYDPLKNTEEELKGLEQRFYDYLSDYSKENGMIFLGYSGSDDSILNVLEDIAEGANPFPYGFYWCIRRGDTPNGRVTDLVEKINQKNKVSSFVEISDFDNFAYSLYRTLEEENPNIETIAEKNLNKKVSFYLSQSPSNDKNPIKLNALPVISYPTSLFEIKTSIKTWKELRKHLEGQNIVAALYRGSVLAFGKKDTVNTTFSNVTTSEITIKDTQANYLRYQDSFFMGMLYDFIHNSLVSEFGLECSSRKYRRYYSSKNPISKQELSKAKVYANHETSFFEGLEYQLEFIDNELFLILLPTVVATSNLKNSRLSDDAKISLNKISSNRYNQAMAEKMNFWQNFLRRGSKDIQFNFEGLEIKVNGNFSFSNVEQSKNFYTFEKMSKFPEPLLKFNSRDSKYNSCHPLKGLKAFGPYDLNFTQNQSAPPLKFGLITTEKDFSTVNKHLESLKSGIANKSETDYLIEYLPFDQTYKRYLEIPSSTDSRFCQIIDDSKYNQENIFDFYNEIKRRVDYFYTLSGEFDILVIYIPSRWKNLRELKNDSVYFDLHDSLKIYCAKKNIKVQFIEQKSIEYFDQSKVRWWLSLALYAKSNGIPWVTDTNSDSSAFIGISYATKRTGRDKVVLGSSQIFDSSGQGMRFLLQPIEKPVYYGKNPFMSEEDARRLIIKLKEAYFRLDPNSKLNKLVLHKTTHFTKEEIEGISKGANGIENIELLQIQHAHFWKGIRGNIAKRAAHMFPQERGTVIQLDEHSFLLWTHGSVAHREVAGERMNYYQGKRGTPSPLLVRRFLGQCPIEEVVNDILTLTKMNWNGGELYKSLPVTLDFSKKLSGIAKQEESLHNTPYDFRYFI